MPCCGVTENGPRTSLDHHGYLSPDQVGRLAFVSIVRGGQNAVQQHLYATPTRPMFADSHLNGADWDLWLADGNPVPHAPE